MESLYPPDKPPIPPWNAGVDADKSVGKANELVLPDGRRPEERQKAKRQKAKGRNDGMWSE
jgi:hypothetical protein